MVFNQGKTAFFKNTNILEEDQVFETSKGIYSEDALATVTTDKDIKTTCKGIVTNAIQSSLKEDFWPKTGYFQTEIFIPKGKKSSYPELDDAFGRFKDLFGKDLETQLTEEQTTELQAIVSIWKNSLVKANSSPGSLDMNDLTEEQINYNLAVGYAWLGNFSDSWESLSKTEGLDPEMIKNFSKWLTKYENKYMMSNFNYDVEKMLLGKWVMADVKYQTNSSNKGEKPEYKSLMDQIDGCNKEFKMTFFSGKKVTLDFAAGCDSNNYFWRVYRNKKSEEKYLIWDSDINELGRDANSVYKFKSINSNQFEVIGHFNPSKGEMFEEAVILFEKILN
ncbi:hypothetical protein N6H18_05080 [Reichenbachiella agarivorans]|uniref:Uncharacterized protein n=1 Tax=Reichenbachiella agarivorans TaxID=2979464 RepID=A0ABY6CV48_9BACT|nr:hypothetical protein [Reichenbachiella agarivorans]UXP33323.1 hypothetical protein N6H18_05080 [Reichenbachiella agarivorans]